MALATPLSSCLPGYSTLHAYPVDLRYEAACSPDGEHVLPPPKALTGAMPFPDCGAGSLCRPRADVPRGGGTRYSHPIVGWPRYPCSQTNQAKATMPPLSLVAIPERSI